MSSPDNLMNENTEKMVAMLYRAEQRGRRRVGHVACEVLFSLRATHFSGIFQTAVKWNAKTDSGCGSGLLGSFLEWSRKEGRKEAEAEFRPQSPETQWAMRFSIFGLKICVKNWLVARTRRLMIGALLHGRDDFVLKVPPSLLLILLILLICHITKLDLLTFPP